MSSYVQAKRLDELEKLYREEQVSRKRAFNMMEDLKGKIRVYCRVRPILNFEKGGYEGVGYGCMHLLEGSMYEGGLQSGAVADVRGPCLQPFASLLSCGDVWGPCLQPCAVIQLLRPCSLTAQQQDSARMACLAVVVQLRRWLPCLIHKWKYVEDVSVHACSPACVLCASSGYAAAPIVLNRCTRSMSQSA
eukprot:396843-Pelagomonas_calceolata.AAC.2